MAQHDERKTELAKALEKLSEFQEKEIDKALSRLGQTDDGRKLLWWLLQIGGVGTQPFAANALNMSFNCGVLDVGNKILARIVTVDAAVYVRMMQENDSVYRELERRFTTDPDASGDDYDPASTPGTGRTA